MWSEPNMSLWQGRQDGDDPAHRRWHQAVIALADASDIRGADVILGFASDEGVRRNQGRIGAVEGPDALRRALANLPRPQSRSLFDGGTVSCVDGDLEAAQSQLGERVTAILERGGRPLLLGGGHEIAWGSFLGIAGSLSRPAALGIINFDAHFDLRDASGGASSGTPFRQISQWCEGESLPFNYLVLGVNPAANTQALYDYGRERGVRWFEDVDCVSANLATLCDALDRFLEPLDYLYLTICLDAFPAGVAPGVSAPGMPGICPRTGISLLRHIREACERLGTALLLCDVAEMNPTYDQDGRTARWAARLIGEMAN